MQRHPATTTACKNYTQQLQTRSSSATHVARTAELCFAQLHDCHAFSWRQDYLGRRWLHCWVVANEGHARDAGPSL
eukprot:2345764-Lingulodinium_polyedra.AAC.1